MSDQPSTALRTSLDLPVARAVERVTAALATKGFGILTEIDIKATMKKKLDLNFREYVILGACNPQLAFRALSMELEIGLFLPCNVIVYDNGDGRSVVSIVDPIAMMMAEDEQVELLAVATEAKSLLEQVIAALS